MRLAVIPSLRSSQTVDTVSSSGAVCNSPSTTVSHPFDYKGGVSENWFARLACKSSVPHPRGPVAQLGARFHGMEEVVSSNLTRSTKTISYTLRKLRPHVAVSAPPIIPTQGPKKVQTRSKVLHQGRP